MSIRHLVVASLLISAGAAQADVVSSTSQPAFQNGWTTGNGSSVIGSGVFGSGVSLVGGIAHNANTDLTSVLVGKASASLSQSDAQKLFVQQGIDASYVLSAGNGLLAARFGNSAAVINDGDGVKIVQGQTGQSSSGATSPVAGGAAGGGAAVGGGSGSGTGSAGGSTGGGSTGGGSAGVGASNGSAPASGGGASGGSAPVAGGSGSVDISLPPVTDETGDSNATQPVTEPVAAVPVAADPSLILPNEINEVPEPGTIALMLAGLAGVGMIGRRRKAK
ncbi:PEP-CTERM sorting domain-containing protein [Oxalobacteraceae sp. CFBP 8761]|nr:PEP-CTERM sorting domain-containing protein [Oxalobacteraceae sp. CFBP 8761]